MANVKVAVRVRPLNSRESLDGGRLAVQVEDKVVRVRNVKLEGRLDGRAESLADSREKLMEFGFDYCYWSADPSAPNFTSQEEVFQDLGVCVLSGASEGYNVCLFAYGQTGSGKTYTMMGTPDSMGLTPRICQGLFRSGDDAADGPSCRVEISFLEIYNERVRDLLRGVDQKKPASLRVREHPEKGPYVQGLSQHVVTDYKQAVDLLEEGIANRITAATHVHDASSRSHAIFTIQYTQAILENNLPSEIVSKINLVDLAGSERADPHYCRDRITEGANINKSLVTLGIVISALAQNSQMFSSSQSINSVISEGEGSTVGSQSSSLSGSGRRHCFIPYRDSVLTWLLKDSLGGNSKTIMIATVAPSSSSYSETLSTLRYAAHARNIVNKPRVNEDANVRLIRELREEIDRLKSMLLSFEMQRNSSPSLSDEREGSLSDIVLQNELKVEQLTKDWSDSWHDKRALLERYSVDINQDQAGVLIHSLLPHVIALEPDVLSTGVTIYHLPEGVTSFGPQGDSLEEPHIVLPEGCACEIENHGGVVTLKPVPGNICMVSEREVTEPCRLVQGAVITLGRLHKFRFNHPAEAAVLRERRRNSEGGVISTQVNLLTESRVAGCHENGNEPTPRQRLEEQQWYIQCLREEIQLEQKRAERDLDGEQARLQQQHTDIQQWILQEKQRLAVHREKATLESGVQTELYLLPPLTGLSRAGESSAEAVPLSFLMGDRKRVVQEELLKHHALRRAENRVRRKRLRYQLEKIARKRHLLEAKRELQRLENELLQGGDEASSPEVGYTSRSRGRSMTLRRHSFSADLLSRLYPQHTPIFSHFLKRNRSSELTAFFNGFARNTKRVSDEFLKDQKIRRRSNTMPSRYQGSSNWQSSSETLKSSPKDAKTTETKTNASDKLCLDTNTKAIKKVLPIIKHLATQNVSAKGTKSLSPDKNKGLETIRKVFSRSVSPGMKTALAKVFRKPPSGSRGNVKSKNKTISQSNKTVKEFEENKEGKCSIKSTMSYESLEQLGSLKYVEQRYWHSTEALTHTSKKWVGVRKESFVEDPNGSSDCDSIFSVDSLSSAYATALAEQLQQEECDFSEDESEDSEMSQDSLVMESSGKHVTARPVQRLKKVSSHFGELPTLCSSQSTRNKELSEEVPAEVFWSFYGNSKLKMEIEARVSRVASECRPGSGASIREPDSVLALTDAWSSTDAVDSPRMSSGHLVKHDVHIPRENTSLTTLELSDNINVSEGQSSPRSDSTQGDIATLEEQNTSFENTLIFESHESDPSFVAKREDVEMLKNFKDPITNAKPCTTHTDPDGVTYTSEPTNDSKLLEHTVTKKMMIQSSKDGDISTDTNTLQCFQANSSRKYQKRHPTSCPEYPEVKNSKAWQGSVNGSQIKMDHPSNSEVNVKLGCDNRITFEKSQKESNCFYPKQCTEMANKDVTKDSALTIKQSNKHDEKMTGFNGDNEQLGMQLGNDIVIATCQMNEDSSDFYIGNMKLPKKCDVDVLDTKPALINMDHEQSACLVVNSYACSAINGEFLKLSPVENLHTVDKTVNSDQELKKKIETAPKSDALKTVINRHHSTISRHGNNTCDSGLTVSNSDIKNFNENNMEDKNDAIQIMERRMFNNKYFQMSDSAVNDKISEVVKEHFSVSLREDCEEDHESDTTKENIPSAQLDDFTSKKNSCGFEYSQAHLFKSNSLQAKPEVPTDSTTDNSENCGVLIKSRHPMTMQNSTILNNVERKSTERAEQEGPDYSYISDNMSSVEYCAIKAPSTDGQNTNASKTVVIENGKVTVLNHFIPCMCTQVTPTLKQTHRLDEISKVDQQNAQIVNNTTKSVLTPREIQEHNFDSKLLRHLKLFNETCLEILMPSSKSNIPQVSLPAEAMVNRTDSVEHSDGTDCDINQVMESSAAMLPNDKSEDQIKKENIHLSNSSIMDQSHSAADDKYCALEAQPLSKLAFYEFGPVSLGKYQSSVSQDKANANHLLGNSNISIGSSGDKSQEGSVEQIYHSYTSDDLREDAIVSDFSQEPQIHSSSQSQRPQMDNVLETCDTGNIPQGFLENHSFCTSNHLETMSKSQHNNGCIKGLQSCINQNIENESSAPQNHQKSAESDKTRVKPSTSPQVDHNTKQASYSQNRKEQYNNGLKSKNKEHSTTLDATKHVDGNGNDDKQREKPKRYRKAHFKAPPSSSTDSTTDLSLDESNPSKVHVTIKGHLTKPSSQAPSRQNPFAHCRLRNPPLDEKSVSSPSAVCPRSLETQRGNHTQKLSTVESIASQGVHGSTEQTQKINDSKDDRDIHVWRKALSKDTSKSVLKDQTQQLENAVSHARDSAMHFFSSDINPFIHTRTDLNRAAHKNQAFGSDANISCKHSPLSTSNKNIIRCCSVDNGLNIHNSPFSSHLSTYANHKGLSSTLSSDDGCRDQISSEPLLKTPSHSTLASNKQTITTSYNGISEELRHSSGQVDEIVLVYSSEYESQNNRHSCPSKCDHGTQTVGVDLTKKNRHRRSSTQSPVSKPGNGAPTTWSSLQNMSEHISDLIYNTSDLLENIQCMRTGDRSPKFEHPKSSFNVSTLNSGSKCKRDGCTQTSMDIGIQTEMTSVSKNAHEVNVIVKVIGSEICNVSQLDGVTKKEPDFERIKSLPDLRPKGSSKAADSQNVLVTPSKVYSLETVVPDQNSPSLEAPKVDVASNLYKKSSSIYLGGKQSPSMKEENNQTCQRNIDLRNCCNKKPMLMDRASSPILTVKAARYGQRSPKNTQLLTNNDTTEIQNDMENRCSDGYKMQFKEHEMLHNQKNTVLHQENHCILRTKNTKQIPENTPLSLVTLENLRDVGCPNLDGFKENSINTMSGSTSQLQRKYLSPTSSTGMQTVASLVKYKQEIPARFNASSYNKRLTYSSGILEQDHRSPQHQEDDVMSLVPSECNTDILVSIDPLTETSLLKEHQRIPDDLPIHNKFTNWSGINQQPSSPLNKTNRASGQYFTTRRANFVQMMESQRPEPLEETDRRTSEIEKLRKEREQVLASVHLDPSPHQLTVELTEAKLHYGQGETDTLLKIVKSGSKEVPTACSKQELFDRHRRSIESLRKEREVRIQMCRRPRSLSPGNRIPVSHEREQSPRISDMPSRRREYLQQLRQEIVETSRVPDPPRREGQCPSDIEILLRDYSRAREEARAEIACARHRLRERTEQEKRRLQQQALLQAVKDDLRFRTRTSNSTLCTGSNLSLSSGPTSGYNSSNAATLKDNTSPTIQINGVSEFKVRTRPPVIPLQTSKAQRRWLSVQDVSQESFANGYESSSIPSSPPCARQRTLSFDSPSSLSSSYQDIADCTLASAISEIYLASAGDVKNLLAGKATAGWRHQGVERGVQVFYKPNARTTAHGFLGAAELERPLDSLWYTVRDQSKTHLYHESVRSAWTRPLDEHNQLVYLLMDTSNCQLKQPRDFCCLSTESKQDDMWVLAMQSVFEETLPRPSVDTVRGEMLPSAWIFQPSQRNGQEIVTVIYLLQVDLGTPSLAPRLLNTVSRKQATVIADLDSFFSL
ncbi:uncharacterized protein stard9 isoform X2 [Triplophysa rosa]|uniref:StAR-related lipid transfer protein 9 n=1 Tax=Triplophysa rosa TaxID=992332 RepID=A0A9W7TS96_TRIRA|nr:uncharacterized protein stard9 isoform X2 [Triplophysa rosa]KAI7804418.1 putative stAR-related lipid transfer protein 9 [Triplophysa rosa]